MTTKIIKEDEEKEYFKKIYSLRLKTNDHDCKYIKHKDQYIVFSMLFPRDNLHNDNELNRLLFDFISKNDCLVFMWIHYRDSTHDNFFNIVREYNIDPNRFYLWLSSEENCKEFENTKFNLFLINASSFVPNHIFDTRNVKKEYNIVYSGNLPPNNIEFSDHYKRWDLCPTTISDIAVVDGGISTLDSTNRISRLKELGVKFSYINERFLSAREVARIFQKSKIGIILSTAEGGCFSSSEYLSCGLPVVSCKSVGGRSLYYDDYNSIVCKPYKKDVTNACLEMIKRVDSNEIDSTRIRNDFLKRMAVRFELLKQSLKDGFNRMGIKNEDFNLFLKEVFLNEYGEVRNCWEYFQHSYELLD